MLFLILGLVLGAVTVIFALQNTATIAVTFLFWQIEGSLALMLLLAVFTGIIIFILFSFPELIKMHLEFSALQKRAKKLEEENAALRSGTSGISDAHQAPGPGNAGSVL